MNLDSRSGNSLSGPKDHFFQWMIQLEDNKNSYRSPSIKDSKDYSNTCAEYNEVQLEGVPVHLKSNYSAENNKMEILPLSEQKSTCSHAAYGIFSKTSAKQDEFFNPHNVKSSINSNEEKKFIDFSPSISSNTCTTILPATKTQIVLLRNNGIVMWNPVSQRTGARLLTNREESVFRAFFFFHCPTCGQSVDVSRFSYEAQSYFRILEKILRSNTFFTQQGESERIFSDLNACGQQSVLLESIRPCEEPMRLPKPFKDPSDSSEFEIFPKVDRPQDPDFKPKNLSSDLFVTGYYSHFFREIMKLGSGSFGHVYLCHHYLDDVFLGEYAVKKIPVGDNKNWFRKMLREVKIRERLHNTNIVEYKHSWVEINRPVPEFPLIPWLFVLMEYCSGGNLEEYLMLNNYLICNSASDTKKEAINHMKDSHIWKLFLDIANGLNHLHHSGILHRDLKSQNILLQCSLDKYSGKQFATALLSDFGTSEILNEIKNRGFKREGFTGTVEFTAPELLELNAEGSYRQDYDEKSDIWSLGIILFQLCYGYTPYYHADPQQCRLNVLSHRDPSRIIPCIPNRSEELVLLLKALLQRNPDSRPFLDTVLGHKEIKKKLVDTEMYADAGFYIAEKIAYQNSWRSRFTPDKKREARFRKRVIEKLIIRNSNS